MTTTLIVRDATLAINGAPDRKGEPREHLRSRVAEVANMDARTAEECIEVLSSVAGGEGADPEVLEALMIVALAHPALQGRMGLKTVATGRRLAARLERLGEIDRTLAVLELLQQYFPGQETLERDLGQLMRRQGMVQDLVNRYFQRAQKLAREGRNHEAAGWLREVLQLDPSRKDAARLIRNLRFKSASRAHRKGVGLRFVLGAAALVLIASWEVRREIRLFEEFRALPQAVDGRLPSVRRRLSDLERFMALHPVWHGALRVLSERSELRVQVGVLEEEQSAEREEQERARSERLEAADLCRARGMQQVEEGDLTRALESFRQALEFGGTEWPQRERVLRDVADMEAHLGVKR
jgi:tetratricopeptide (TPR) repeat protein